MTNKTIEEIAKSMLEDFKGRDIKKCDYGFNGNVLNLVELLELALREQAAQTALPSREEVFAWHKQYYERYNTLPLPMEVYDWLRDNSAPKAEEARVHSEEIEFESGVGRVKCHDGTYVVFLNTWPDASKYVGKRVRVKIQANTERPEDREPNLHALAEIAKARRHEVSDEEIEKEYDNYRSNNYSNSRMEVWVAGYRAALERMK